MLRLVLQLAGQLNVLFHSHLGCSLQLLLIHTQHLVLDSPNILQHFLPQLVNRDPFLFSNPSHLIGMLALEPIEVISEPMPLLSLFSLQLKPVVDVLQPFLLGHDLLIHIFDLGQMLGVYVLEISSVLIVHFLALSNKFLCIYLEIFNFVF